MRSAAKLSYQQTQAAIDGLADDDTKALVPPILEPLYAAYRAVKKARDERVHRSTSTCPSARSCSNPTAPSIAWSTPERLEAHRLIEEFMILANVAAAETLERARCR